ncbi:NAD-dependent epimerase/dehydratase family protein [Chloroflexota bacterium]
MKGQKVLVVGASGFVGCKLALDLCRDNEVYGLARFRDEKVKKQLESGGVTCISKDMLKESLDDLPGDFDFVFNNLIMTEFKSYEQRQSEAMALNAYLVGRLMERCRTAKGFIQTSTNMLYPPSSGTVGWKEDDNVRPGESYPLSKFTGEVVTTFCSTLWNIPTCILRLGHPYSEEGGAVYMLADRIARLDPIAVNKRQSRAYNPIYLSDYIRYSILATNFCTVSPRVINVGGIEIIPQLEMLNRIGKALGIEPIIVDEDAPRLPLTEPTWITDITLLTSLMGEPLVLLEEGIKRVADRIKELQAMGAAVEIVDGKAMVVKKQ